MTRRRQSVAERVVETVASRTDTDPLDLTPLYETVDPDALDAVVRKLTEGEITFRYAGCAVTVDSTGSVQVEVDDHGIGSDSPEGPTAGK